MNQLIASYIVRGYRVVYDQGLSAVSIYHDIYIYIYHIGLYI